MEAEPKALMVNSRKMVLLTMSEYRRLKDTGQPTPEVVKTVSVRPENTGTTKKRVIKRKSSWIQV